MSVKKEPSGKRSVQVEVEVPGTPEEVWRAISTGRGISSWFVPTKVEEELGGKITFNFGPGMDSTATITAWEPPVRFAAEDRWGGEEGPMIATEWFVEARSGGVCLVRVVHSLFSETDDWDNQLEGTEGGWPLYFRVLRLYMTQFRGMQGSSMVATGFSSESPTQSLNKLMQMLSLTGLRAGQKFQTGGDAPQISGIVEWNRESQTEPAMMLKLDPPGIAIFSAANCGGPVMLALSFYRYGDSAPDISQQESEWQAWMSKNFPAPAPSSE
jgi:uncharacterized protein YndB with AHSA1/START domain